jgi:transcriptional regulator with XRE-family HTH domain
MDPARLTNELTPAQIRAARGLLSWSIADLATKSNIHRNTLLRAEKGEATVPTLTGIRATLEAAGVLFISRNGGGEGVRLAAPSEPMLVVSRKRQPEAAS